MMQFFTAKPDPTPKKCVDAQRYLITIYPRLYTKIAGYRNSKNVEEIEIIRALAEIRQIKWKDIESIVYAFVNCNPGDREREPVKKKMIAQSKHHRECCDLSTR